MNNKPTKRANLTPQQKFELRQRTHQALQQAREIQKLDKSERAKRHHEQAIQKQVTKKAAKPFMKKRRTKKSAQWFDAGGKAKFARDGLKNEHTISGGLPGSGKRS